MRKFKDLLDNLHFPLWILKDAAWLLQFGWVSLILAIPTIFISLLLILYTIGDERKSNFVVLSWLLANTTWMMHEMFNTPTKGLAIGLFSIGILIASTYIPKLIRGFFKP